MIRNAESHADEAHRLREAADTKNLAETLAYQTERSLSEHRDKLDESDASTIEGRVMELRQALEGDDLAEIRAKMDALQESSHKLAEVLYAEAAAAGAGVCGRRRQRRGGRVRRRGRRGGRVRGRRRGGADLVTEEHVQQEDAGRKAGAWHGTPSQAPDGGDASSDAAVDDRLLRLAADFENYKKRAARERQEYVALANERLIGELLPILDDLERALAPPRSIRRRSSRRASASFIARSRGCSSVTA